MLDQAKNRSPNISRRRFLKNVGAGTVAAAVTPAVFIGAEKTEGHQMQNRPNVIFILTDDQGPWAAGCCGNDEVRTPFIDQLASEGTRFPNFFLHYSRMFTGTRKPDDRTHPFCPRRTRFLPGRQHATEC